MTRNLGPLQFDSLTKEPFLRLRKHPNIVITPPRITDIPFIVPPMNDERVYNWICGAPYPYYEEHAREFIDSIKPNCDKGIEELEKVLDGKATPGGIILSHFPIRFLREVHEDGSETFLGDIGVDRCAQVEAVLEDPKVDDETNLRLPAGHPDIVWTIGNYLVPSHHGRGIMSDAVQTIIKDLGSPYLGVRHIVVTTFIDNKASMRVFLKNGFAFTRQLKDHVEVKGKIQSLNVFELHFPSGVER